MNIKAPKPNIGRKTQSQVISEPSQRILKGEEGTSIKIKLPPLEPEIKGYTTIWLSKKTKAKLNELRQRGATYDDVINSLLELYNKDKGKIII